MFFDEKVSKSSEFYCLELCSYPSFTDIVEAMNTIIQEKHDQSKAVSQLKCLEELKTLRSALQVKDLVLHSLVRTWDTFSEVNLLIRLEWCWE